MCMRKNLLSVASILLSVFTTSLVNAQADRFAYAVTDVEQAGGNWSFLRKLDLNTSEYSKVLLTGNDVSLVTYDAASRKQFATPYSDAKFGNTANAPFATGVAAMAYDRKNNRLWYTPMFIDQLRYIDLKTMKIFFVTSEGFTGMTEKSADQANIVTRMVIASDGNGYALTNDAQHLIQFTTGKHTKITDLGMLVDDPANKGTSIHNSCSSFGGDVIADDNGKLYVFSARNHVFKVDLETKVATHLGMVTGLPANYTINGAAVNDNNKILVASATITSSWFNVDLKTLVATSNEGAGTVWRSSDLANSNLLTTKGTTTPPPATDVIGRTIPVIMGSGKVQVYPNPVTNNQFTLQFNQLETGSYSLMVTDVMGRQVIQQSINVSGDNQTQTIRLDPASAKGIYLVKILDAGNKEVFTKKVVVQ